MLSPPNQGSEIADALNDNYFYRWHNGPAGQQLGTGSDGFVAGLGSVNYPVGVSLAAFVAAFSRGVRHVRVAAAHGFRASGCRVFSRLMLQFGIELSAEQNDVRSQVEP